MTRVKQALAAMCPPWQNPAWRRLLAARRKAAKGLVEAVERNTAWVGRQRDQVRPVRLLVLCGLRELGTTMALGTYRVGRLHAQLRHLHCCGLHTSLACLSMAC